MYLAKFFHRPPGDDDRELLLAFSSDDPVLMGIRMREDGAEFLREEFSSGAAGVAAFRKAAEELRDAGFMETAHTRYTLRTLLPDPQPKPDWQKALDELMLSALVDELPTQAARIEALRQPPTDREPLYLWLAAHHGAAASPDGAGALTIAEAARDAFASRKAGRVPIYTWSIPPSEIEARIFEVISRLELEAGNVAGALAAIEQSCDISINQDRSGLRSYILCEFYPERREEAFDNAFRYAQFGGYELVTDHPDYAAYLEGRKKKKKSDKGWRWSKEKKPASESDLAQAEARLGSALPKDYRAFMRKTGRAELLIRFTEEQTDLRFFAAGELATQRDQLFDYLTARQRQPGEVEAYFKKEYGVSLRDLVPIAEPRNLSRCLVIHLGAGERYGWCYLWDHDGAWELEAAQPGFDAALKALTRGIEGRDQDTLRFFDLEVE